jgi:hypothetical protein
MHPVVRMRPAAVAADRPAKMAAVIAMGVSVTAPDENNLPAGVDPLQRQRGRRASQRKACNSKCSENSDSHDWSSSLQRKRSRNRFIRFPLGNSG